MLIPRRYAQLIVNFLDSGNRLDHHFGQMLYGAAFHPAHEGHITRADGYFDVARVYAWMFGQTLANIFLNALIRAPITFGPASGIRTRPLVIPCFPPAPIVSPGSAISA